MSGGKIDVKVVLLGKAYAGKTSLVNRYIHDRFDGEVVPYQNTIGAAFAAKTVKVNGKSVVIGIWDTAGSERYEAMSRIYYRGAKAAIICYDLTDKTSFDRARFWIGELQKHEESCQIHLCGTKCDLIEENPNVREISLGQTKALGQDVRGRVYETSSKTGKDIDRIFTMIAMDHLENIKSAPEEELTDTVELGKPKSKKLQCPCR